MEDDQEQAQAPYTSTFVRLGRSVWFTLESSFRANAERASALEERLQTLGDQVKSTAEMGIPWMRFGDWDERREWSDDEWEAFLRTWKQHAGFAFSEDESITEEEKELVKAFGRYWVFYACLPDRPEGAPEDATIEADGEKVDLLLEAFEERLGDPLMPCASCQKCAVGYKLFRCSRCKRSHYCSRDCQAKHWRRGHKRECTPVEDE